MAYNFVAELVPIHPRTGFNTVRLRKGEEDSWIFGRRDFRESPFPGDYTSTRHIQFTVTGNRKKRYYLSAPGGNGTYLNGTLIEKSTDEILVNHRVKNNDRISIVTNGSDKNKEQYPVYEFRTYGTSVRRFNPTPLPRPDPFFSSQDTQPMMSQNSMGSQNLDMNPKSSVKKNKRKRRKDNTNSLFTANDDLQPPKKKQKMGHSNSPPIPLKAQSSQPMMGGPGLSAHPVQPPPQQQRRRKSSGRRSNSSSSPSLSSQNIPSPQRQKITTRKKKKKPKKENSKKLLQLLKKQCICPICSRIFRECVRLSCGHSFCGQCITEWHQHGKETCPECGLISLEITQNRDIRNNIEVGGFKDSDTEDEDEKPNQYDGAFFRNKIVQRIVVNWKVDTNHVVVPPPPPPPARILNLNLNLDDNNNVFGDDDEEEDEDEDDDREEDEDDGGDIIPPPPTTTNAATTDPYLAHAPPCPECTEEGPDGQQCTTLTPHERCYTCHRNVPIRKDSRPTTRGQTQCTLCNHVHCNLYFPAPHYTCDGTNHLLPFRDHKFDVLPNKSLNHVEMEYFENWVDENERSVQSIFDEIIEKMDENDIDFIPQNSAIRDCVRTNGNQRITADCITPDTNVCKRCARKLFKDLIFMYRYNIPEEEFPENVQNRDDCKWGRRCRTQWKENDPRDKYTKAHTRFNHICL